MAITISNTGIAARERQSFAFANLAKPPRIIASHGPVVLALRALREAIEAPPRTGPVTDAIRTMRAALPDFDADLDVRRLRRAIAERIEADLNILDFLGGDADDEPSLCGAHSGDGSIGGTLEPSTRNGDDREQDAGDEPELDESERELTLGWCENVGQLALGSNTDDGDATALESYGAGFVRSGHDDAEDGDNGIADSDGKAEQFGSVYFGSVEGLCQFTVGCDWREGGPCA